MTLAEYLESKQETIIAFAKRSQLHRITVSRLIAGKQKPSAVTIAHIARHTGQKVNESDWSNGHVG